MSQDGLSQLPWETALYTALSDKDARLGKARAEYARLLLENRQLTLKVRDARERLSNWKLRQEAWRRERAELLARIDRLEKGI